MFAHAYTYARTLCMLLAVEGSFDCARKYDKYLVLAHLYYTSPFTLHVFSFISQFHMIFHFFLLHGWVHRLKLNSKDTDHLASPEAN